MAGGRLMRALILYAHPCADSFNAAVHRTVVESLGARGWAIDDCDLYAEGFEPLLSDAERRHYHAVPENVAPVAEHVARLRAAQALVLVFPVWNFGYPAILKGYLDRVFLPGVSFRLKDGKVTPNLTHIRKLAAVTTYGATRLGAFLAGDPPRKSVRRVVWNVCRPETLRYVALHDIDRAARARLDRHLDHVARVMRGL